MADLLASLSSQSDELYNELLRDYIENRILVINDEISECVIEDYALYILKWNRDDEDIPAEKRKPITIFINSPGGSSFDGFALVDVILQSKTPINGVAIGLVASMGYHIYLSCHNRYAFNSAILLQHDGETIVQNSSSKAKQTMKFFEDMEKRTKSYVLNRTTMTEEFYDSIYEQEFWFYPDKGKELGVVHKIIGIDCELDEIM